MVHARLEQDWTDPAGVAHAAGASVDVDAATLADLQAKGIVADDVEAQGWIGPTSTGGDVKAQGWIGPTSEPKQPKADGWIGPTSPPAN
ncbi:hypothetical protein AB0J82_13620 [Asanoa sp. NPDC049518]|uniref:hypothetical protein n=1 Tax=unclassified Asanoa TaxID=2685164 RepID=UPI0034217368